MITTRIRLLDASSAAGASGSGQTRGAGDGPLFDLGYPAMLAAVQAEISGAPTACVINLMGLIDGATWDTLAVLDIAQGYVSGEIQPISFPALMRQVKANLATLTGGAAPTVSLYIALRD